MSTGSYNVGRRRATGIVSVSQDSEDPCVAGRNGGVRNRGSSSAWLLTHAIGLARPRAS
jgi:hypothetical protein